MKPPDRASLRSQSAPRGLGRAGFTLLEMMVALGAFVLLLGGVFAIANGTMELGDTLTYSQDRALMRQNFIEFLRRSFRTIPGDAEIRLKVRQQGGTYMPTINVYNGGTAFSPGPSINPESSLDLYAEERPGGYLRVGLRLLSKEATNAMRSNLPVRADRDTPVLPLLDNVARFEWRFYDPRSLRWENVWENPSRPLFAELTLVLDDGFETKATFWIPPVARFNPAMATPPPALGPDGTPLTPTPDGTTPPSDPSTTPPPLPGS